MELKEHKLKFDKKALKKLEDYMSDNYNLIDVVEEKNMVVWFVAHILKDIHDGKEETFFHTQTKHNIAKGLNAKE